MVKCVSKTVNGVFETVDDVSNTMKGVFITVEGVSIHLTRRAR